MPVDMFEHRFREELARLPAFKRSGRFDARVWHVGFPAWRAVFTAMCLMSHSSGYRLPTFDAFFAACRKIYAERHPESGRFREYFQGQYLPGMRHRAESWYESGMAETYLYACLVEAIEDRLKAGLVLYDPRADWKLKCDVVVLIGSRQMRVNSFVGPAEGRGEVEADRNENEKERKTKTKVSSHWGNRHLATMNEFRISRTDENCQVVNGIRLFSLQDINILLRQIYDHSSLHDCFFF